MDVPNSNYPNMSRKDFYKELRLRGYHYNESFRAVKEARSDGLCGKIEWKYNWVTFMDAMLQIQIVGTDSRTLLLPTKIQKLRINGAHHFNMMSNIDPENRFIDVYVDQENNRIVSGGIEMIGVHASPVQRRRPPGIPVLEKYKFLPHFPSPTLGVSDAIRTCVQIALENNPVIRMKIVEVDTDGRSAIIKNFLDCIEDLPQVTGDFVLLSNQTIEDMPPTIHIEDGKLSTQSNCHFVVIGGLSGELNESAVETSHKSLVENGYLLVREHTTSNVDSLLLPENFKMIAVIPLDSNEEVLLLLQYQSVKTIYLDPILIEVSERDTEFKWIEQVHQALANKSQTVLYAYNENLNGLIGLVNCLRKEPDGNLVSCFFVNDKSAPPFSLTDIFYSNQHALGLAINVYQNVSYCILKPASFSNDIFLLT